jgi:hypothetical protein
MIRLGLEPIEKSSGGREHLKSLGVDPGGGDHDERDGHGQRDHRIPGEIEGEHHEIDQKAS